MNTRRSDDADPQALCTVLRHARHALCQRVAHAAASPDRLFSADFPALVVAVEDGFRREELTMEALGIPGLHERRKHNALILSALHHASSAVERGNPGVAREVVCALRDQLHLHRHAADLMLAVSALQQRTDLRPSNALDAVSSPLLTAH